MAESPATIDTPLGGLKKAEWFARVAEITEETGYLEA
jgi:hypothetical protein